MPQAQSLLRRRAGLFLGLLALYTLVFGQFLHEHWVHDAYLVAQTGYSRMPAPLYSQGRVFSALFYRALEALSVPYDAAMAISVFCSVLFLTLAVVVVYDQSEPLRASGRAGKGTAVLAACALFFNLFVAEFFLFYETAIMALGILLAVLAARALVHAEQVRSYGAAFLLLTASVFCYQADIAFFLPLVLYFLTAKGGKLWRKTVHAGALYGASCLTNLVYLRLVPADGRAGGGLSDVLQNIGRCLKTLAVILQESFQFLPAWWFFGLTVAAAAALLWTCIRAKAYKPLLAAALSCGALAVCTLLPLVAMAADHWYAIPRAVVALAGLPGLLLLFLPRAGRWQMAVAALLVLLFTVTQLDLQWNNRKNSAMDAAEIGQIVQTVRDYEARTNAAVDHIAVTYDSAPLYQRPDLRPYGDATLRILSVNWMPYPMLEHAFGGTLPIRRMDGEDATRLFAGKNWDAPSPEQLVLEGNVLYLCLY